MSRDKSLREIRKNRGDSGCGQSRVYGNERGGARIRRFVRSLVEDDPEDVPELAASRGKGRGEEGKKGMAKERGYYLPLKRGTI